LIKDLVHLIEKWIVEKKTGKIIINFFKGGISNVEKHESIKIKK